MVLKYFFVLFAALALQVTQEKPVYKAADSEVQALVREALADRLAKRDIPDAGLLKNAREMLVRREMRDAGLTLTPEALPNLPDLSLSLIAEDAAQARANTTKQNVYFIEVDRPAISGTTATLWIGVDFAMPSDPRMIKMCCCASEAHFEKRDGRWHFTKWGVGRCY